MSASLDNILDKVHQCTICADKFAHEPRPVLTVNEKARIIIIGQAPGLKVHQSGIPWNDASGKKLRTWLDISEADFYNHEKIAILPMAFCYPGKGKSGDLPPPKICATTWHKSILDHLKNVALILLVGSYACKEYLKLDGNQSLTWAVKNMDDFAPFVPLPHPSPRNQYWLKNNPWFEEHNLKRIRKLVHKHLS